MKKILPILSLLAFASCGEKGSSEKSESTNILENLTFSVDTVVVDPGEDIIDLSNALRLADVSTDRRYLYLFQESDNRLSVVNLDQLTLQEKTPFEKEGPNGVGSFLWNFDVLSNDRFLLKTYNSAGIFDYQGKKYESINLDKEEIDGIEEKNLQNNNLKVSKDLKWYYGIPGSAFNQENIQVELAVIDCESMEGKLLNMPALDQTQLYRLMLRSNEMIQIYSEDFYLSEHKGKFMITSSVTSDIYTYDPASDSLSLHVINPEYAPKEKTDPPAQMEVTDMDAWRKEIEKLRTQVKYNGLLWDESSGHFFRFASVLIPSMMDDIPSKTKVFLLAFDEELNLIGEIELDDLDTEPSFPFFKDGKLYSYVNVEDELGFAVFTFDF